MELKDKNRNTVFNLRRIDMATYSLEPERYELRSGNNEDAPNCPYGNKFQWIGYDLLTKEYIRFTKSVFKKLIVAQE